MSVSKLLDDQVKAFADLQKRLSAAPSAGVVAKLGAEALEAHVTRIDARIAQLEEQKKTAVARIDKAIERERETLKSIVAERPDVPIDKLVSTKEFAAEVAKKATARAKAASVEPTRRAAPAPKETAAAKPAAAKDNVAVRRAVNVKPKTRASASKASAAKAKPKD